MLRLILPAFNQLSTLPWHASPETPHTHRLPCLVMQVHGMLLGGVSGLDWLCFVLMLCQGRTAGQGHLLRGFWQRMAKAGAALFQSHFQP